MPPCKRSCLILLGFLVSLVHGAELVWPDEFAVFEPNPGWEVSEEDGAPILVYSGEAGEQLHGRDWIEDELFYLEFKQSAGGRARVFVHGSYPIELEGVADAGWRRLNVRFRAPRYDEGNNKLERAFIIDARVGEQLLAQHVLFDDFHPEGWKQWEYTGGATSILVDEGEFMIRRATSSAADFDDLIVPAETGGDTNEADLVDYVLRGREQFKLIGCAECHAVEPNSTATKNGPSLWGLFTREPREREVTNLDGTLRFNVIADRDYLMRSVRQPMLERSVAEYGEAKGEPYLPLMPPYTEEVLPDNDAQAISSYLATLNEPFNRGPAVHLVAETGLENYDPMNDRFLMLVTDRTVLQRAPMAGVSARSIHVGQTSGAHFTFDPRILGVAKVWQGGFLNMGGEWRHRGGGGAMIGYQGRDVPLGELGALFHPLHADGEPVDFSFKEAIFDDVDRRREIVHAEEEHFDMLAAEDAEFLGYTIDPTDPAATPVFRMRVGENHFTVHPTLSVSGVVSVEVSGDFATPQLWSISTDALSEIAVSGGEVIDGTWTVAAGESVTAKLTGRLPFTPDPWRPEASDFLHSPQPLLVESADPDLPAGYAAETWLAPKDNLGRTQLFEPLGMDVAADGTLVVAARTGSIWRVIDDEWHLFAEGLFDVLGVIVEDESGLDLVVGQKAELTRVRDTNGDGRADSYETLCDDWGYHGNYHTYIHGPVKLPDGNYLVAYNLADSKAGDAYFGEGEVMGSLGGYTGWALVVTPEGEMIPWADGLRSPAGLGVAPDGQPWYADNQGDYVSTSKIHTVDRGAFYGHPVGLIDRPGEKPGSDKIKYDAVKDSRARAPILIPQGRLANSLGNPVWDQTAGEFGPFGGQMIIGDQTQSLLVRVVPELVGRSHQGSAMILATGFESGIMRPVFLPDGSLLLGQTGRGWSAWGGHVASMQRVWWDGKTVPPGISSVHAVPGGFHVKFSMALAAEVTSADLARMLTISSWTYRDAPAYGSDELDERIEAFSRLSIADDRQSFRVRLARTEQPVVHPDQTARVYLLELDAAELWGDDRERAPGSQAFYTLYEFPPEDPVSHPDSTLAGWSDLLADDLGNADYPEGIWWWEGDLLTASEDQMLWSKKVYRDFDLDLEFRTAGGTNSGVLYHVSIPNEWVQNSIEVQVADDYSAPWVTAPGTWQCGAVFGRLPAAINAVNLPGQWNRMTLHVRGKDLRVILNGHLIVDADLSLWTDAKLNPDGTEIPPWLSKPLAELPAEGRIGFQGKHAGAPVWFRNIRVREIKRN